MASFSAKVATSLNGVDPSFYELSCWILLVKPSGSNILLDKHIQRLDKHIQRLLPGTDGQGPNLLA